MRAAWAVVALGVLIGGCGTSTSSTGSSPTSLPAPQVAGAAGTPTTTAAAGAIIADLERTPGVTNPQVTQATIRSTICVAGWTKTVRPPVAYTNELKIRQLLADPRYTNHNPADYEEDHLIPLELGGDPRDPGNLWPEPHARSLRTDAEEDRLRTAVCTGKITLADGQAQITAIKRTLG